MSVNGHSVRGGAMPATTLQAKSRVAAAEDVAQRETLRIDAASLVAARNLGDSPEGRSEPLTNEEIATRAGVSRTTLYRWMHRDPDFAALVGDAEGQIKAEALRVPSANVHYRIKQLDRVADRILQVMDARAKRHTAAISSTEAADPGTAAMHEIMGNVTPAEAATGLMVSQPKISASGRVVTEWAFDAGPIRELRETYKHIAQQLKQWEEGYSVSHTVNEYHDDQLSGLTIPQLEAIDRILTGEA